MSNCEVSVCVCYAARYFNKNGIKIAFKFTIKILEL